MIETIELFPGIRLHCVRDDRFKQGCLSIQFVRPMAAREAAKNALIPAVLLRGTERHRDLRDITLKLDDLYGASVSALVRRIGDYQTTGLYCSFMEDRYAMAGDKVLEPMVDFLWELLFQPVRSAGGFSREFVESEKRNLILTIESERNDKRAYAATQLLRIMCKEDSFGIPRLGTKEQVAAIDHKSLYLHYQQILRQSAVELFYVGSRDAGQMAALLTPLFASVDRNYVNLPNQSPFHDGGGEHRVEQMDVAQGKLCMGFVTSITNRSPEFAAMQVFNCMFGAGMTSKLFMQVREKLSLCYSISSGYYGSKGIVTVGAGIDMDKEQLTRQEIEKQLAACVNGDITKEELQSAKEAILTSLRSVHDSPGAIEGYYATAALSGIALSIDEYREAVENTTIQQVQSAAATVKLHSSYFLKGVNQ